MEESNQNLNQLSVQSSPPEQNTAPTKHEIISDRARSGRKRIIIGFFILVATIIFFFVFNFINYNYLGIGLNDHKLHKLNPLPSQPISSPTPDPTANWQTYVNDQYGFSFEYPADWKIKVNEPRSIEGVEKIITTFEGKEGGIVLPATTLGGACGTPEDRVIDGKKLTICYLQAGIIADIPDDRWQGGYKDRNFTFSAYAKPGSGNKELIRQILSTFKFTN